MIWLRASRQHAPKRKRTGRTRSQWFMKILCVIDNFGSGGAQRQMVALACGLAERHHEVEVFSYAPQLDFFGPALAHLTVHSVDKSKVGNRGVLAALARLLATRRYDAAIAFLGTPGAYAELARLLALRTRLVVSERSNHQNDGHPLVALGLRVLHGLTDVLVANSAAHAAWLQRYPWLRHKVRTIYNGYPLGPDPAPMPALPSPDALSLLVVARIGPEKNGLLLVRGLAAFGQRHGWVPTVRWAGRQDTSPEGLAYRAQIDAALQRHPDVAARWHWLGERKDIPELLAQHHALILASLYEGMPNVVCEAFFAGRPVLASHVGDLQALVEQGNRGFLFDPHQPDELADALSALAGLDAEQLAQMGQRARRWAEQTLTVERMVVAYERAIAGLPEPEP